MRSSGSHLLRSMLLVGSLSLSLCAASPPIDDGASLRAGLGYGQYEYLSGGGCDTPVYHYDASELRSHLRFEQFWKRLGLNLVIESHLSFHRNVRARRIVEAGAGGDEVQLSPADRRWEVDPPYGMVRAGYHHDYFGAELGVMLFSYLPFLSATSWAGHRRLHMWASLNAEPIRFRQRVKSLTYPLSLGVGHRSDRVELRAGYMLDGAVLEGHHRFLGRTWFGARLNYLDRRDWGVIVYWTYTLGRR